MKRLNCVLIVLSSLLLPTSSRACSVCIAHALGAGHYGVGAQTIAKGTYSLSFGYIRSSKSQDGEDAGTRESMEVDRWALSLYHGVTDRWMVGIDLPYERKSMRTTGMDAERSQGLGDVEFRSVYQIPASLKSNVLVALDLGLKLPTGNNKMKNGTGDLLEQHLQSGSGSTDFTIGSSLTSDAGGGSLWFGGLSLRHNGVNSRGFRYGDTLFYNAGYALRPMHKGQLVLELHGRVSGKDHTEDGSSDPDSGGMLTYASVSYRLLLPSNFGLVLSFQQPVLASLNGSQKENAVVSVSVGRSF